MSIGNTCNLSQFKPRNICMRVRYIPVRCLNIAIKKAHHRQDERYSNSARHATSRTAGIAAGEDDAAAAAVPAALANVALAVVAEVRLAPAHVPGPVLRLLDLKVGPQRADGGALLGLAASSVDGDVHCKERRDTKCQGHIITAHPISPSHYLIPSPFRSCTCSSRFLSICTGSAYSLLDL